MGTKNSPKISASMAHDWVDSGAASVDNLVTRFESLSPVDIEDGCEWYAWAYRWCEGTSERYGVPILPVTALCSVLSANTPWPSNMRLTTAYLESHVYGTPLALRSLYAHPKALAILSGEDPDAIVGGPKIRRFWYSILSDGNAPVACLDRWAVRALFVDESWRGYITADHALVPASYSVLEPLYLEFARRVGLPAGQAQACLWGQTRGSLN